MTIILTESTCDAGPEWAKLHKVEIIPQEVIFGDESFFDQVDMDSAGFYEKMRESSHHPSTALISAGRFSEYYNRFPDEEILVITLAEEFSGTNNSAHLAVEASGRDDIVVLDTRTVAVGTALLLDEVVRLRDEGLSAAEIAEKINAIKDKVRIVFALSTMKNLVKGGRISPAKAAIGAALSVKPILTLIDGQINPKDKARGMKKAISRAAEIALEDIDLTRPVKYLHANNIEGMEALKAEVGVEGPANWLGNAVGVHAGEGAVGIGYFAK